MEYPATQVGGKTVRDVDRQIQSNAFTTKWPVQRRILLCPGQIPIFHAYSERVYNACTTTPKADLLLYNEPYVALVPLHPAYVTKVRSALALMAVLVTHLSVPMSQVRVLLHCSRNHSTRALLFVADWQVHRSSWQRDCGINNWRPMTSSRQARVKTTRMPTKSNNDENPVDKPGFWWQGRQ